MHKIALTIIALVAILVYGCTLRSHVSHVPKAPHAAQVSGSDAVKNAISPAPENILAKTLVAFGKLKSFRLRETMDPVAGSHATYQVEVLVPNEEHVISRGDCPNNQRGESIRIGSVRYSRCGLARWTGTQQSGRGTPETYQDYLKNTHAFALTSLDGQKLWQIMADYPGGNSPPGTMTWLINQEDFLPRKLTFITLSGYALTSEFRDFDDPSIVIGPPVAR